MAYKLIWSPASRDDLRDIVSFISRVSAPKHSPTDLSQRQTNFRVSRRSVGLSQNTTSPRSVRLSCERIELFIASIMRFASGRDVYIRTCDLEGKLRIPFRP